MSVPGCTCGYGGVHEPENQRCALYGCDVLVAVSPEVARLIEAVGPDNLPTLLRVAWLTFVERPADMADAIEAVPFFDWGALGVALDGPVAWEGGANGMDGAT